MIFITGATGLLGARLVFDLHQQGERMRLLRRSESDLTVFHEVLRFYSGKDDISEILASVEWEMGDILDPIVLEDAMRGCSACIHAGAMVSFHPRDAQAMYEVNVAGTANMVNAALHIGGLRFIMISSVAAIGRTGTGEPIDEDTVWKDSPHNTQYALSKYGAEMEVWRGIEEGLEAVMVNPSIILGAGSEKRSSGTLFGTVKSGSRFYTDGYSSLVDVRDVSAFVLKLLSDDSVRSERYVLCSETIPYKQLFEKIASALGKPRPNIHVSPLLLAIGWRLAWLKDKVTGSHSPITKETARSAQSHYQYKTEKAIAYFGRPFLSVEESVTYHSGFFS